jgi:hypothetical protein
LLETNCPKSTLQIGLCSSTHNSKVDGWVNLKWIFTSYFNQCGGHKCILLLTPFKSNWGITIFHMKPPHFIWMFLNGWIPMWISLCVLHLEIWPIEVAIGCQIGTIIGFDNINKMRHDPKFCITLDLEEGYLACHKCQYWHTITWNYSHGFPSMTS